MGPFFFLALTLGLVVGASAASITGDTYVVAPSELFDADPALNLAFRDVQRDW